LSPSTPARVTFLGTGTSTGVPMIGCECEVCRSDDPRDRRLRPSIYVDVPGRARILVDTSTDLRQQALTHRIAGVEAILFTHGHADHVMGFDEIRRFNHLQRQAVTCYASESTWSDLHKTFHYVFGPVLQEGGGVPIVEAKTITGPFDVNGVHIVPVPILHGRMPILGFRFGRFAYVTDCSTIPDESWPLLDDLDVLVIGALRRRLHTTHFNVDQAVDVARRLSPKATYFTHISHDLGHRAMSAELPVTIELAYDGLSLDVVVD
jgi:phosphoribosyl 1,2-cyclic phosphate phosphodiesterase